jgi:hypothetical protein
MRSEVRTSAQRGSFRCGDGGSRDEINRMSPVEAEDIPGIISGDAP